MPYDDDDDEYDDDDDIDEDDDDDDETDEPGKVWAKLRRGVTVFWLANIAGSLASIFVGIPLAMARGREWDDPATLAEAWACATVIVLVALCLRREEETSSSADFVDY
jgi:hypothetical protein